MGQKHIRTNRCFFEPHQQPHPHHLVPPHPIFYPTQRPLHQAAGPQWQKLSLFVRTTSGSIDQLTILCVRGQGKPCQESPSVMTTQDTTDALVETGQARKSNGWRFMWVSTRELSLSPWRQWLATAISIVKMQACDSPWEGNWTKGAQPEADRKLNVISCIPVSHAAAVLMRNDRPSLAQSGQETLDHWQEEREKKSAQGKERLKYDQVHDQNRMWMRQIKSKLSRLYMGRVKVLQAESEREDGKRRTVN